MLAHKKEFDAVSIDMPQTTEAGTRNLFYFVFILCCAAQLVGSQFPHQGLNLRPQQ